MSKDQSSQVRKIVPYKPGKRQSTFRNLNLDFAGTALDQALLMQEQSKTSQIVESAPSDFSEHSDLPDHSDLSDLPDLSSTVESYISNKSTSTRSLKNQVGYQPSRSDQVVKQPGRLPTKSVSDQVAIQPSQDSAMLDISQLPGYKSPNILDDEIMPLLTPSEQVVLRRLYRLSYGFNRAVTDPVSYSKLSEKCHLGITALKEALKSLQLKKLIKVTGNSRHNPMAGNQYELTVDLFDQILAGKRLSRKTTESISDLVDQRLGQKPTRSLTNYIKDHDHDDLNNKDHHQRETMRIYQSITGNDWSKNDETAYTKISKASLEHIEIAIRLANSRATQRPGSLAYFVKEILSIANPAPATKAQREAAMREIIKQIKQAYVGRELKISELADLVKEACVREGVAYDHRIFNEILG